MRDELLSYYERELRFIRRLAGDFAERYPAVAQQLVLGAERADDPHVERLIEAFAMLTARVQLKLDDEYPQITEALLERLFPEFLAPLPAVALLEFELDAGRREATTALTVPRHSLLHTRPVDGVRCFFRTAMDVELWPIAVQSVELVKLRRGEPLVPAGASAALRIQLGTLGSQSFADLPLDRLRFHLDGESGLTHALYELLFRDPRGLLLRVPGKPETAIALPDGALAPGGFGAEESLLGEGRGARRPLRLLQEFFWFPKKFLFADFTGLDTAGRKLKTRQLELLVLLDQLPLALEGNVEASNFRLGCTPVVNLFPHQAEPIRCEGNLAEYRVQPDLRAPLAYEVHRILAVEGLDAAGGRPREYRPFYALRHGDPAAEALAYWESRRRGSLRKGDEGSEVTLSLVDRGRRPRDSAGETLVVRTLCSNRDLPARLAMGDPAGDFSIEGRPGVGRIRTLQKPTPCWRLAPTGAEQWRLLSLLNLNHLSLLREEETAGDEPDGDSGPGAFRELLQVLDFSESASTRQRIEGLLDLRARRVLRKIPVAGHRVFARGLAVTVELDESKYAGSGVFLFASVLERFFALYASINAFVELTARVRQREGVMKTWPPRAGEKAIL